MIFGIIAASIFAILIGVNIHNQDMTAAHKQEQKTRVLQREVKQLKKDQVKRIQIFHGDEIADLGGDDVK